MNSKFGHLVPSLEDKALSDFKGLFLVAGIIFCFVLTSFSFAQEDEAPHSLFKEGKKVVALDVRGNKNISTSVIVSRIKTRINQIYSSTIARDDIKRLYDTGYFSDIKIDLEDSEHGVKVIFFLKEKPLIGNIAFKGLKSIRRERIQRVINSQKGQYLDYPKLNQDIKEIKSLYAKRGFSNVLIEYSVNLDEQEERAEVEFLVNEGKRIKIRNINILGAVSFSEKRILKLMKTKRKGWFWFSKGLLKEDVLEEDIQRILFFYRGKGFIDIKVAKHIERDEAKGEIHVTITVEEGRQYRVGNIKIKGNKVASLKDLEREIEMIEGEIYTEGNVRDDAAGIQAYYFEKGYIFARVDVGTSLNPDTGLVNITYNIIESEVAYINRINIRGNIKTKDKVVRRELRMNPGEQFDGKKLRRSKERIYNLGFFEEVGFDMLDTDQPTRKDLIVEIKEAKTGEFSFGGGYSSVDQFIGFAEIAQRNFDFKNFNTFTGAGQDLRLRTQLGSVSNSFELSFTEPWIFDYPLSFGFDAYRTEHKRESNVGYGYDEKRTGGDVRFAKELTELIRTGLTYRLDNVEITDIPSDATDDLKKEEGENLISSLGLTVTRDTRDNIFSPTKGTVLGSSFEVAGGPFGGDKDFFKIFARGIYDMPVFRMGKIKRRENVRYSVLEFRLRAGMVDEFDNSDSVPIYERFYAGGSHTIRGYNERKVGPIDSVTEDPLGGEAMLVGNIEYTHPLLEFIKAAVFYDVGNVWSDSDDLGNGGFKSGTGLGLRIKTPIGPIKLDYGYPLNDEPGEDQKSGKFHFSVSRGF